MTLGTIVVLLVMPSIEAADINPEHFINSAEQEETHALANRMRELGITLEAHRRSAGLALPGHEIEGSIREAIIWLTSSCAAYHQLIEAMSAHGIRTASSITVRIWWMERGVNSPALAQAYMQGVGQGNHPERRYGAINARTAEDLMNAGGAGRLLLQDLNAGRADDGMRSGDGREHNRSDNSVDQEAAIRLGEG